MQQRAFFEKIEPGTTQRAAQSDESTFKMQTLPQNLMRTIMHKSRRHPNEAPELIIYSKVTKVKVMPVYLK